MNQGKEGGRTVILPFFIAIVSVNGHGVDSNLASVSVHNYCQKWVEIHRGLVVEYIQGRNESEEV